MNEQQKRAVIDAAKAYAGQHNLSNAQLSKASKVNNTFISFMMRYEFSIPQGEGKKTVIADKWFVRLATYIGYQLKKEYWKFFNFPQFAPGVEALDSAKHKGEHRMIIGNTGCGKTEMTERFKMKHPTHTYRVTANSLHTVKDLLEEIKLSMGITVERKTAAFILRKIIEHLIDVRAEGHQPVIIIDEGENLTYNTIRMMKGLYDGIRHHCGIAIMGTHQLITKLDKLRREDKAGVPQFCRRFKAGITVLDPVMTDDFEQVFDHFKLETGLRKLLRSICTNFGELRDYLEPALREADEQGVPLTEQFFRVKYNMPKI